MKISAVAKTLLLIILLSLLLFWPFLIPGIVLGLVLRGRLAFPISIVSGLLLVALYRYLNQQWTLPLGESDDLNILYEIAFGLISWAIGAMLFLAGYRVPSHLSEGFRSVTRSETKAQQGGARQPVKRSESIDNSDRNP